MTEKLCDDVWKRQGISLLWNPEALAEICRSDQVISLYQFFQLFKSGWSQEQLAPMMVASGRALVVAGLETALDAHEIDEIVEWVEQELYPVMRRFQQEVADGGRGAALILWIAEARRFDAKKDPEYHFWITKDTRTRIDLARALFNGASNDLRAIYANESAAQPLGLYHPRIS